MYNVGMGEHIPNEIGFLEKFDLVREKVTKGALEDMPQIAKMPGLEEIIFNVIACYDGDDPLIIEKLKSLGQARLSVLKEGFKNATADRTFPGKMEYDTTLDALKRLDEIGKDEE